MRTRKKRRREGKDVEIQMRKSGDFSNLLRWERIILRMGNRHFGCVVQGFLGGGVRRNMKRLEKGGNTFLYKLL